MIWSVSPWRDGLTACVTSIYKCWFCWGNSEFFDKLLECGVNSRMGKEYISSLKKTCVSKLWCRGLFTDEEKKETVDLSRRGLKKIEKAPAEESHTIINLILDQNELQRLDNIDTYNRVENVRIPRSIYLSSVSVGKLLTLN